MPRRRGNHQWVSARNVITALGTLGVLWLVGSACTQLPAMRRYIRMLRM